jgi:hypothetical protein
MEHFAAQLEMIADLGAAIDGAPFRRDHLHA